jgi:hypothetical protein
MKPKKMRSKKPRTQIPRPCPECGSVRVVPIIYGVPTPAQKEAIKKAEAVLADREEWEGMTQWYCKSCGCDWSREWRRFKKSRVS